MHNVLEHAHGCVLKLNLHWLTGLCSAVKSERELLSSHGFTQNQLTIWYYPSMAKIAELTLSEFLFMDTHLFSWLNYNLLNLNFLNYTFFWNQLPLL